MSDDLKVVMTALAVVLVTLIACMTHYSVVVEVAPLCLPPESVEEVSP